MKDRFKFRAYNFLSKKYTYFDKPEVQFAERNSIYLCGIVMPLLDEKQSLYFGKYDLQQCTGLKDKNGKLIYEGDIVKDRNNFILQITYRQNKGAFYLENNKIAGAISELKCSTNTMEVIGNKFQNPELLRWNR